LRHLLRLFPALNPENSRVTSPQTQAYNCFAWAAGDAERWWQPDSFGIYYWPPSAGSDVSIASVEAAYACLGYSPCKSGSLEPGVEKIAVYADATGRPTHATRQLKNGLWTSKCGAYEDIEHELLALSGKEYGNVELFMQRPRPAATVGTG
jgi:hypothetical protein